MKLTPTQAATRWKKSKATLYNKMNAGELSFEIVKRDKRDKRLIDVSELIRVFGTEEEQEHVEVGKHLKIPNDQVSILLADRITDLKAEVDYLKAQLADQKATYEARIQWLEKALEAKEGEALESLKAVQSSVGRLLEDKREDAEVLAPTDSKDVLKTSAEPEIKPEQKAEPKKKKGMLFRMIEAALD